MTKDLIGVEEKKETIVILDTEFVLQFGKIRATMKGNFIGNIIMPPVPLHSGNHAWECFVRQALFILLLQASFYDHLGFKPKTFKYIENQILSLIKQGEISAVFWGEN
jgi:hypothetical protein